MYENRLIKNVITESDPVQTENVDKRFGIKCYAKRELIDIGSGKTVDFLGVRHTKETLDKFGTEIGEHIENSDVLLSELAVFEDGDAQSDMEFFYKAVTKLAKDNGKKIVVADPEKKILDAIVNRALSIAPALASLGSGAYLLRKLFEVGSKLEERMSRKRHGCSYGDVQKDEKIFSRREFLKLAAAAGIMSVGGMNATAGAFEEIGISKGKGELLEAFLLDSLDYRNALITKEILHLSEEYGRISVIYGATHAYGIKKFLGDRELLERKLKLYESTYGIANDDEVRVYDFSRLRP